ncbi:glycoside hydrolase family 88 protein [Hymenobacter sp. 15J16-1T3B]|uniref:glycoside hydrolase family 88 protein n=1 Tax=Hymenobacter sp. 15J16-1T3B TaxID=2886941 RepID=UPI001D11D3CC|nr:glycoside hydrolase family 88 protein [Hymenobacter sp. 15J16-1T3B]MCC3159777.1 glycoside hydrolase family 88 protein [Hymenobacter sp. 15J16-1T3B]
MNRTLLLLGLGLTLLAAPARAQDALHKKALKLAETQAALMLRDVPKAIQRQPAAPGKAAPVSPRSLTPAGELAVVPSRDWTSGFFPGYLWLLSEATGQEAWRSAARTYSARIEPEKTNGTTHDLGFMVYCPFGQGYRLTQDAHYREVILQAARTLSTRFSPVTKTLRSWDHHKDNWQYPVIIDNMMNLELLFAATRFSGDSSFYQLAVTHANTTLRNHFRPDYSSYHVVDYDTATGQVRRRMTHQGFADESAWARGQAWALYGFTMCYRETRNPAYLRQAEHIAGFILNHPNLPKDLIPYWDFNAPDLPNAPRDASAGAIMASALYELSTYSPASGPLYRDKAEQMVRSLAKSYTAKPGGSHGFLLLHSTGHKPANSEIDVPLIYADYYFLEALQRRKNLAAGAKVLDTGSQAKL